MVQCTFKKGDEQVTEKSLPAVDYLKIPDDGEPYLEGHKCENCGAVFLGERSVCSKCFTRAVSYTHLRAHETV